jgi:hypothetical protein
MERGAEVTSGSGGIGGLPPSPPAECLPDAGDCSITHSATGWCLVSTGQPVILLVNISCETGNPITITTLDPSTGGVIPNGPVVPCGDKDWEINQLCDVNPVTGEVIATVTQIFEWDETTGAVVIRLERPDAPGIPYVPTGVLQTCAGGQLQAVETVVCGNTAGILRQLTEVVLIDTLDGTIKTVFYLDNGALAVLNPGEVVTAGDCWTATLPSILDELEEVNGTLTEIGNNTDGLEACCASTNAALLAIQGQLTTIIGHVDGIEGLITATNAALAVLIGHVDGLEGLITASNALLTTIASTVYAEDSPHVSGSNGTFILAVRNDTNAVVTSADGDYSPISVDSAGRVKVDGNFSSPSDKAEDSPHVSGDTGSFSLGVRNDAGAVLTSANGDYSPMATDSAGRLGISDLGGSVSIDDNGGSITVDGSVAVTNFPAVQPVNDNGGSLTVDDGGGSITVDGTVAVGPTVTPGTGATNLGKAEDAAHASGDVGVMALGVRNDNDVVRTSADGDYSPVSVDSSGRLKTVGVVVSTPQTSGGLSIYKNLDVNNVGQVIKGSTGQVYTIHAINRDNDEGFLKLYNKATAPTAADVPVMTIPIGPTSGNQENSVDIETDIGYAFSLGIGIRATKGLADGDNTNTDANAIVCTIGFK